MTAATIVWFRRDLRLADNPALREAVGRGGPVVPVYVHEPDEEAPWQVGSASKWWLHHSLAALNERLEKIGSRLTLLTGPTAKSLVTLSRSVGARAVLWNRRYEPAAVGRDTAVKQVLRDEGLVADSFNASLLNEPWEIQTKTKRPYQVYTPYRNAVRAADAPSKPLPAPSSLVAPEAWPESTALDKLGLLPEIDWAKGMRSHWTPGESGATERLTRFLGEPSEGYASGRDRPDNEGTSSLSPHLHFGEISPRTVWHRVLTASDAKAVDDLGGGALTYLKEVVWREFAYQLLYHFPDTTDAPLRTEFAAFPWRRAPAELRAWQRGRTGYPYIDAGMRQLWSLGWMHNRLRMAAASFLVKHLLLPWQAGSQWFWDTLVDADLANNSLGWQWVAGCGADAAPYFRIFNPVTQGKKFDPHGEYVRRWVPELQNVPDKFIHEPWEATPGLLKDCGVTLGDTYPHPIVEHTAARNRALQALSLLSKPAT